MGGSREEVSKGMLHRFGLEDSARARMAEFGNLEAVKNLISPRAGVWYI